jgi:hypothetical protein
MPGSGRSATGLGDLLFFSRARAAEPVRSQISAKSVTLSPAPASSMNETKPKRLALCCNAKSRTRSPRRSDVVSANSRAKARSVTELCSVAEPSVLCSTVSSVAVR